MLTDGSKSLRLGRAKYSKVRKALLLGIDAYEEDSLRLNAAARDVEALAKALVLAGFTLEHVRTVVGSKDYLSTAKLRKRIKGILNDARAGDEILIYFSGHGVEWDGRRLLLPQDFDRYDPEDTADLICDTNLYQLARSSDCGADAVIYIIDACRDESPLTTVLTKSSSAMSAADRADPTVETPSIAFLFSCATGEVSHATDGDDAHSFFSRALCDALTADDDISTLDELRASVQSRLDERLRPSAKQQTATLGELSRPGRGGDPGKLMLKENPAARLCQRIDRSPWIRQISGGPLCRMVETAGAGLALQLKALIVEAEDLCRIQRETLTTQRWSDASIPARTVKRLELLLADEPAPWLTPVEAAVAIAIPYVYEAILAAGEQQLQCDGDPLQPGRYGSEASRMALALRNRNASEAAAAGSIPP